MSGRVVAPNNRLEEVKQNNATIATYTYNGKGERTKKESSTTTHYFYNQNGQLISELDNQGNTIRDYVYLGGEPLALIENDNIYYYHNDHIGTPQFLTDSNQQVAWAADYDPFGKATITTETITNNLRSIGQYFDVETGDHYNKWRYLDPDLGRYKTSDRIGLDGGLNTYSYVSNNPINRFDPLGLFEWTGTFDLKTASYWIGGAWSLFELESECVDGEKWKVTVRGRGVSADIGVPPGSEVRGEIAFEDFRFKDLSPNVFDGTWSALAIGPTIGPVGGPLKIYVGDAISTKINSKGIDISAVAGAFGESWVETQQKIQCECD